MVFVELSREITKNTFKLMDECNLSYYFKLMRIIKNMISWWGPRWKNKQLFLLMLFMKKILRDKPNKQRLIK